MASQNADKVTELAVLLQHIARGADGTHGRQLWDSLARVISSPNPGPGGDRPGIAEFTALRQAPDDNSRAEALAGVLVQRAGTDPAFGKRFRAWRRRKNVQTLEASIHQAQQQTPAPPSVTTPPANPPGRAVTAPVPATPAAAPPEPPAAGWKMSEVLQTTVAIAGLAAALLALRWPLFQVASILTLMIAGTALWYHRWRGQSWRARSVTATGGACVLACAVLATTYFWHPSPSPANPRPHESGSSSHNATTSAQSGSAPFEWTVSRASNELNNCESWKFSKPLADIPIRVFHGDANAAADEAWALQNGGIDVNGGAYTVTLQGKTTENVDIEDIRVKIISRKPAVPGIEIFSGLGCGGQITVRFFAVALNGPSPALVPTNINSSWPYTISSTDIEQLCIDSYIGSGNYEYSYAYEVDWAQGSRTGTTEILAPNKRPFVAVQSNSSYEYINYNGKWVRPQ